jgi:hypothetical protein
MLSDTLDDFLKSMKTAVELAKKLEPKDMEILYTMSDVAIKTDTVLYMETQKNRYKFDPSFSRVLYWVLDMYSKKIEFPPQNESVKQMQEQMLSIFRNIFREVEYYEDGAFEELRKYADRDKFLFLVKTDNGQGYHVQTFKTTDTEPYYIKHGMDIQAVPDPNTDWIHSILPNIDNELITPYFITSYVMYENGVEVGPSYKEHINSNYIEQFINNRTCSQEEYYNQLPNLNERFRRYCGFLSDFLCSEEDSEYCVPKDNGIYSLDWNIMEYEG